MRREVDLNAISDGKRYELNDLVKADCHDCEGCFDCCCGMGESILLDPYDVYRLTAGLGKSFAQLLDEHLELHVVDGVILPNLRMAGERDGCTFLSESGRCSIHPYRPGICRLFPLGRVYENGSFRYFLQVNECKKDNRSKIKVKKWIDTPDIRKNEQFVLVWHDFCAGAAGASDSTAGYGGRETDQSAFAGNLLFSGLGKGEGFLCAV